MNVVVYILLHMHHIYSSLVPTRTCFLGCLLDNTEGHDSLMPTRTCFLGCLLDNTEVHGMTPSKATDKVVKRKQWHEGVL